MRALALVAVLALAGCSGGESQGVPGEPVGPLVEGWIVDERIVPVVGATVRLAGAGAETMTDDEGHYALQGPVGAELVLVVQAEGFLPQSRGVSSAAGARQVLNFTLERVPVAEPYDELEQFQGILRCGVVATTQEDPSRPHEHQGVRCSQLLNDTSNRWAYTVPANTTGVVVEAAWDPQSEVSQAMVMKVATAATGEVLGFIEGTSMLRQQLSSTKLQQELQAGHDVLHISLEPGAGTGNHEHGAAGAFVNQGFTLYATAFFNGPVPPTYTVAER